MVGIFRALSFCGLLILASCSPVSFMSSTFSTLDSSSQERGLGGYVSDGELRTRYHFSLFDHDHKLFYHVKSNVYEGKILLTGCVPTEEMQEDAVRLAWQVPGVKAVINEMTVGNCSNFVQTAKDKWISTKLNTLLLFDGRVRSRHYDIFVVDGVVYLLGIAKSQDELDAAIDVAQGVSGVQKVISYVRVITNFEENRRKSLDGGRPSDMEKRRRTRQEERAPIKRNTN
jgi:osmotically-inducible protein OsmY